MGWTLNKLSGKENAARHINCQPHPQQMAGSKQYVPLVLMSTFCHLIRVTLSVLCLDENGLDVKAQTIERSRGRGVPRFGLVGHAPPAAQNPYPYLGEFFQKYVPISTSNKQQNNNKFFLGLSCKLLKILQNRPYGLFVKNGTHVQGLFFFSKHHPIWEEGHQSNCLHICLFTL